MIDYLAIVAFCVGQQCGFYADTTTPYDTKLKCERKVLEMEDTLKQNGANPVFSGCIPLRFVKV